MQRWHHREVWRVVEEFGDANPMRPASIMIFVGSLFQDDRRMQDAAFTGLEALILANSLPTRSRRQQVDPAPGRATMRTSGNHCRERRRFRADTPRQPLR